MSRVVMYRKGEKENTKKKQGKRKRRKGVGEVKANPPKGFQNRIRMGVWNQRGKKKMKGKSGGDVRKEKAEEKG